MSADPWYQPQPSWQGQVRHHSVGPADVRKVVFATTRMKVGYEVGEVDAFLDQVEVSMEQMLSEIQTLRRRIAATDQANEARMYDIRVALEQLLVRLGGPTGYASGTIDASGRDVPLYTPSTRAPGGPEQSWYGPPQGPVSDDPPPRMEQDFQSPQAPPPYVAPTYDPRAAAPPGHPAVGFPPPPPPGPQF